MVAVPPRRPPPSLVGVVRSLRHCSTDTLKQAMRELEDTLGRLPNVDELSAHMKMSPKKVKIIRKAEDTPQASDKLQKRFKLSERQAQAILDLRLQRLTALERRKVEQEHRDLVEKIEYLEGVLADESTALLQPVNDAVRGVDPDVPVEESVGAMARSGPPLR